MLKKSQSSSENITYFFTITTLVKNAFIVITKKQNKILRGGRRWEN